MEKKSDHLDDLKIAIEEVYAELKKARESFDGSPEDLDYMEKLAKWLKKSRAHYMECKEKGL